ncbi:hypothetical protein [Romboutsia ilealis]|uniref:hypothetical protein n=1 Tax=Romboutsia ilealis TaxID=1115758 RepID=UPI002573932F|nr:hypothetical protein [Romboutsia ilealis]
MFERKDLFQWKTPILILTGILVLSGGIYVGIKTRKVEEKPAFNNETINEENEKTKDSFELSENCEIWLYKRSEEGSLMDSQPSMIGSVPEELLDKTKEEIRTYLSEKYPDKEIDSITQHEIVLSEKAPLNDISRSNKYSLEVEDGFIGLYKYDINGKRELVENTEIKLDSLPQSVQEEIQKGLVVDTQDDAYSRLESFGS